MPKTPSQNYIHGGTNNIVRYCCNAKSANIYLYIHYTYIDSITCTAQHNRVFQNLFLFCLPFIFSVCHYIGKVSCNDCIYFILLITIIEKKRCSIVCFHEMNLAKHRAQTNLNIFSQPLLISFILFYFKKKSKHFILFDWLICLCSTSIQALIE